MCTHTTGNACQFGAAARISARVLWLTRKKYQQVFREDVARDGQPRGGRHGMRALTPSVMRVRDRTAGTMAYLRPSSMGD